MHLSAIVIIMQIMNTIMTPLVIAVPLLMIISMIVLVTSCSHYCYHYDDSPVHGGARRGRSGRGADLTFVPQVVIVLPGDPRRLARWCVASKFDSDPRLQGFGFGAS